MKKLAILMCCAVFLQILLGCGAAKDDYKEPVNFYYEKTNVSYDSSSGVIEKETREGSVFQGNLTAFLHAYLRGPESDILQSIIPSDVYLVSCEIIDNTAYITLSSQFAKLSGVRLTTACSALLLTMHDYVGIDTLSIRAKDVQIDDKNSIILKMEDVILIDAAENLQ